ncbi:MAG: leucyl aminopeptidase [Planctomycetota bacterium]
MKSFSVKTAGKLARTDLLVVLALEGTAPALPEGVTAPDAFSAGFEAKARATRASFAAGLATQVLAIGLGPADKVDAELLRRVGAIAAKRAEALGVAKAVLRVDASFAALGAGEEVNGRALAEGALMGAYRYIESKTKPEARKLQSFTLEGPAGAFARGAKLAELTAAANAFTRDLQNRAGNLMTPTVFAKEANALAKKRAAVTCKVLDAAGMKKEGMGLLLGVSQGSVEPPKLIHLTYKPKGRAKGRVAFVGKGLTFDVGGYSIKPSAKLDEMRYDMSGGAAVLGLFHALAHGLDVPFEVHGIVPASENLIDGNATKPGDIHTAMNGTTVEILNTDAEGRLILADALCYACARVKPDTIVDVATLTGAVIVGLGHELTGMFASTDALRDDLLSAGQRCGEGVWPLPLLEAHREGMKGAMADLANIGSPAMGAGPSQGAAFLAHFVDAGIAWAHLDIAGTAWGTRDRDWVGGAAGSGVGTRLFIDYLLRPHTVA